MASKIGFQDATDSEEEMSDGVHEQLGKLNKKYKNASDSDDEVYKFSQSDDSDKDGEFTMADSDVEGQEDTDDHLPSSKAWGKKKQAYYRTDYVDEDYGGFQNDEEVALLEEEEAKNIQKRLLEQLQEEDFSLELFHRKHVDSEEGEVIKSNLEQFSKRQKKELFEKESPEFADLVLDFKAKLQFAKNDLRIILDQVKSGRIPSCSAVKFIQCFYDIILNYCTNISFYILLKSQCVNIQSHPVIKRLCKYKLLLNQLEPMFEEKIKSKLDLIKQKIVDNVPLGFNINDKKSTKMSILMKNRVDVGKEQFEKKQHVEVDNVLPEANESEVSDEENSEIDMGLTKEETMAVDDLDINTGLSTEGNIAGDDSEKRGITYQIAKNKGLTPHRKKEQRNPRVKHKLKYRKAKIRRKGAVRDFRQEVHKYAGEISGIKANIKKSVKIK